MTSRFDHFEPFCADRAEGAGHYRAQNENMPHRQREPTRIGVFVAPPCQHGDTLKELEYALDKLKMDGFCLPTSLDGKWLGMNISSRFGPSSTAASPSCSCIRFIHQFRATGMGIPLR